jgi:hypothetical protein
MRPLQLPSLPVQGPRQAPGVPVQAPVVTAANVAMMTGQPVGRISLHRQAKNKGSQGSRSVSVTVVSQGNIRKTQKRRTAGQKVAALLTRIRAIDGPTKTNKLEKILDGIQNKVVLPDERRQEIIAMIKERGRLMSQKGYIKMLEKKAKSEAERAAVAAQEAQHAAQEAAFEDVVDNLAAQLGGMTGLGGLSRINEE